MATGRVGTVGGRTELSYRFPKDLRPGRAARVEMNRKALADAQLGLADVLLALGTKIMGEAAAAAPRDPARAAKRGVRMMADTGHVLVYAGGKKVGGEEGGTGKPRSMRTRKDEVVLGMWFSSPLAHLIELGTAKHAAQPFFTPAVMRNIGDVGQYVDAAMAGRIASSGQRAAIGVLMNLKRGGIDVGPAMRKAQAAKGRVERKAALR